MRSPWRLVLMNILVIALLPAFIVAAVLPARRRLFIWGSSPLLSNRYWSEAIREAGRPSVTLMENWFHSIHKRADFDLYFEDFGPRWLGRKVQMGLGTCGALIYALLRARVMHIPFNGFALNDTLIWRLESWLFRLAGAKLIVMPFGADFYKYSRVMDTSLRYGLLASYPERAHLEGRVARRIEHWSRHADTVVAGFLIDGLGRWDVTMPQMFSIDTRQWRPKQDYSAADGVNGAVRVLHTPNHRGYKGTEFILAAVDRLRSEGLKVELVLLERVPNDQVAEVMRTVDIHAEQFIFTGYALSGIEGMASGLPVMANLEAEAYTRLFRRYAFLDECPVLSSSPENLADQLRLLVRNPALREALGRAGVAYVEKYHSYAAARHLFGTIYDRLLDGQDVDLINLYHPLKPGRPLNAPRVTHPLVANHVPASADLKR